MAPSIGSAKITLSCPLFAADFDPQNHGLLLVGGGGGEGRSGVGNKITLLNTSKRYKVSEIVDIDLSQDEDSVTSLAVAKPEEKSMVAFAGINSSQAEQKKGNNRHLRSFELEYPPPRKSQADTTESKEEPNENNKQGKTTPLSQTALFRANAGKLKPGEKVDTYQRLLRLSPYRSITSPRIGAIATGLAPVGEIVLFNVTASPQSSDVIGRIRLDAGEEAEDVDIIDLNDGKYLVAYTNGTDVYTFQISSQRSDASPEVKSVFTISKSPKRSKLRALRFLSTNALVLLENAPNRTGSELKLLSLPSSKDTVGKIVRQRKLRGSVKIGLGLDVVNLDATTNGDQQHIIAIAGSDQSIVIFTVDYNPKSKKYGKLDKYATLSEVHPFSMTKICFSFFQPPSHPVTSKTLPQYVKIASVSLGNTVVVHTLPLAPFPLNTLTPRYVLKVPGRPEFWETVFSCSVALLVVAISCFLLQAFTEIRGGTPAYIGATDWLPTRLREKIARPYMFDENNKLLSSAVFSPESTEAPQAQVSSIVTGKALRGLLESRQESITSSTDDGAANTPSSSTFKDVDPPLNTHIIVQRSDEGSISAQQVEHHDDESSVSEKHNARKWEDLQPEEQSHWKRFLSEAGHWATEEGEQVLQGIFFGQIGGLVGAAVGGG
ncbi:hypothetical protein BGW36DRAFT_373208 [Talaromyces proteolyticus]|uniref:Guanine nucleotide-exchange factor SEC12 n=1 Tax=Talaromyces proteolyticus TaxID=1131652 RepID=A0AAD4PZG9_9EURO|nr:uncharacterized protein BGW36DRAFT_373208 [Talaromyces proteolyticus]KAH8702605.1 hypothetical protein BGW36DRAFT_373208 [Talaromyces proteolyticus]